MPDPDAVCNGCTACSMRCTDGIKISEFEFTRIIEELRAQNQHYVRQVLHQAKELPWGEEMIYLACLFLDVNTHLCIVYPARPLVCRLFGHVPHLPCPVGKLPATRDAGHLLQAYAEQPLLTFQDWMIQLGHLDYATLLSEEAEQDFFEV